MPIGFHNQTNVTIEEINNIVNVTDMSELFININQDIYGGWYMFIMMWVLAIIIYFALSESEKLAGKVVVKIMYSFAGVSLVTFALRGIYIVREGVVIGLLTDFQMWIFPLITMIAAAAAYMMRD